MNSNTRLRKTRRFSNQMESSPMKHLANLTDVMLVFACGLMVAIIVLWNLDLLKITDVVTKDELVEVENMQEADKKAEMQENLNSKGIVYEDEETGKMYIIKK